MNTDARDVLDDARADLDQALSDGGELSRRKRARLWDRGAHAMHQPGRGGVEGEPHLIVDPNREPLEGVVEVDTLLSRKSGALLDPADLTPPVRVI